MLHKIGRGDVCFPSQFYAAKILKSFNIFYKLNLFTVGLLISGK